MKHQESRAENLNFDDYPNPETAPVKLVKNKRAAIIQSSYIPWKGYFDIISSVDEFILFDDVQYTRRDWRNRNKIKTPGGPQWISIPVECKNKYLQKVKETRICDPKWACKHWKTIEHNYSKAKYFGDYKNLFEELYLGRSYEYLSEVNFRLIQAICGILGIDTRISWSMDYEVIDGRNERLISLCKQVGACEYLSGPSAKSYTEESMFQAENIKLTFVDYSGYPEYNQLYEPFDHFVSVIDLIFNEGPNATKFMKRL
ncbi:MAG TPA: WbqC family protein [bacterium]|nr:WbqC family protein [bacterium]